MEFIAVSLLALCKDTSAQNRDKKIGKIQGEFLVGQEIQIPNSEKTWEIIKIDTRAYEDYGNFPVVFVFDKELYNKYTFFKKQKRVCELCNGTGTQLLLGYSVTSRPCPNGCPNKGQITEEKSTVCPICFNVGYIPNGDVCTSCILLETFPAKS